MRSGQAASSLRGKPRTQGSRDPDMTPLPTTLSSPALGLFFCWAPAPAHSWSPRLQSCALSHQGDPSSLDQTLTYPCSQTTLQAPHCRQGKYGPRVPADPKVLPTSQLHILRLPTLYSSTALVPTVLPHANPLLCLASSTSSLIPLLWPKSPPGSVNATSSGCPSTAPHLARSMCQGLEWSLPKAS